MLKYKKSKEKKLLIIDYNLNNLYKNEYMILFSLVYSYYIKIYIIKYAS